MLTIETAKAYLRNHISGWYDSARIDYGVSGQFEDCQTYGEQGQNLRIIWSEDGKRYASTVSWWTEYTAEQIYNIWMEGEDAEELPQTNFN